MNKLPRAVLAVGVAAGAMYGTHEALDRPDREPYAVNEVQLCANAIAKATTLQGFQEHCRSFSDDLTPTAVSPVSEGNRTLTYRIPTQIELLNKELPNAATIDQDVATHNAEYQRNLFLWMLIAGGASGAVVYNNKTLKKIHAPAKLQRKSSAEPTSA